MVSGTKSLTLETADDHFMTYQYRLRIVSMMARILRAIIRQLECQAVCWSHAACTPCNPRYPEGLLLACLKHFTSLSFTDTNVGRNERSNNLFWCF